MGRRSINTTKSGKYMNPTDQARKEARKKELKKNKKQRQMVRAAVLKMKDPAQILEELEKIDEMEYNVLQPSPLNEKVLKEKRKKLKETLERVLKMYDKDEPEKWVELKRQESEYERRRSALAAYHESVRHAQAVQVDDIPLPTLQIPDNLLFGSMPAQIPLPLESTPAVLPSGKPMSILKKDSYYKETSIGAEPPGVPPGPPPSLVDISDDESVESSDKNSANLKQKVLRFSDQIENDKMDIDRRLGKSEYDAHPQDQDRDDRIQDGDDRVLAPVVIPAAAKITNKPTSLQQRMLALSGQNIDEFMKEMEEVHKKRERDRAADLSSRLTERQQEDSNSEEEDHLMDKDERMILPHLICPPGTTGMEGPSMPAHPPPLMGNLMRPPPLRPLGMPPPGLRIPLPNRGTPPGPPPGLPPRLIRLPPGPPPGLPPRGLAVPRPLTQSMPIPLPLPLPLPLPVLSAAPQLINRKEGQPGATITAKPQIRNLSADVTRFVPSALRVKREDKKARPVPKGPIVDVKKQADVMQKPPGAPTKDDAYMQFMNEMQGLL